MYPTGTSCGARNVRVAPGMYLRTIILKYSEISLSNVEKKAMFGDGNEPSDIDDFSFPGTSLLCQ